MSIKKLISIIVALVVFGSILFYFDPMIVNWFVGLLPESANGWKPVLKVVGWIILVYLTGTFSIFLSGIISVLVYGILSIFGIVLAKDKPKIKTTMPTNGKSKWQVKLEEMQAEQEARRKK